MSNSKYIIGAGFLLALLLMSAVVIVGLKYMASIHRDMENIVKVHNVKTNLIFMLSTIGRDRSLALNHMILSKDAFEMDEDLQKFSNLAGEFIETRDTLRAMGLSMNERASLEKVLFEVRLSQDVQSNVNNFMLEGDKVKSNLFLLNQAIPAQRRVEKTFDDILSLQRKQGELAFDQASKAYQTAFVFMIGLSLFAALLIMLIGKFVMRQIMKVEQQLKETNVSLESKVEERTQALTAANVALHDSITRLSDTQHELMQAGKMASLGSLVAGISHEINTPLSIGVTSASSIQEQVKSLREEFEQGSMKRSTLEQFMIHAEDASNILLCNLARVAELVRSFKMVAVDQTSGDWRNINMREYVDETINSLHSHIKRTMVEVDNACDPDIMVYVMPGVIFQLISNFVINSLIHAYVADQVGHIRILAKRDGQNVLLEYSDDGKGMSEQDISRIFAPFFTTQRGQGGSGLGLNIVYNLVTITLKGTITVDSKLGVGTTFRIVFPVVEEGSMEMLKEQI